MKTTDWGGAEMIWWSWNLLDDSMENDMNEYGMMGMTLEWVKWPPNE